MRLGKIFRHLESLEFASQKIEAGTSAAAHDPDHLHFLYQRDRQKGELPLQTFAWPHSLDRGD